MKTFPVLLGYGFQRDDIPRLLSGGVLLLPIALPWAMIAPHEPQARSNHGGQSLVRLAERGGLGFCEAVAVLEDRRWERMETAHAARRLSELLQIWLRENKDVL